MKRMKKCAKSKSRNVATKKVRSRSKDSLFMAALKEGIIRHRVAAILATNRSMVTLFFEIGRAITDRQLGTHEVGLEQRIARALSTEFSWGPCFTVENLNRMKDFYAVHSSPEFLSHLKRELRIREGGPEEVEEAVEELLGKIPWEMHVKLLKKPINVALRVRELCAAIQRPWTREAIITNIEVSGWPPKEKEKWKRMKLRKS